MKGWLRLAAIAIVGLVATPQARAQFSYTDPGTLESAGGGSLRVGAGRVDYDVYAPGMRFPIRDAPAFANSQIYGHGGYRGPGGSQCHSGNYSYPWHDNYCEERSWSMPLCPSGRGHQGQDIRPSTCRDNYWPAVATVDGTISSVGSYSVYLTGDDGRTYRYLHMRSVAVYTGQRVSRGQRLGRVSNAFGGSSTTIHLHFDIRGYASGVGTVFLPTYMSLVRSYEDLVGAGCTGSSETCNGRDDDCDGRIDEGVTRSCGTDVGRCRRGTQSCSGGSWGPCTGGVRPAPETCNDADDDCDGRVDDGLVRSCGTDVGECVSGEETCRRGDWGECAGEVGPVPEICDRLDNDCDGSSDEDEVCEIEELVAQSGVLGQQNTDLDADGDMDACGCGSERVECFTASRRGFDEQLLGPAFEASGFDDASRYSSFRLGDLDADGRADACLREPTGVTCWLSPDGPFSRAVTGPALSDDEGFDEAPHFTTIRLADVDGDGRDDLCARWADGLRCYRFDGHTFFARADLPAMADAEGFDTAKHYGTLRLGDIDGDGMADACARTPSGMRCWRSKGTHFGEAVAGPEWTDDRGFGALDVWSTIRLADVDGDGGDDLCARTPDGFRCHPFAGRTFGDAYVGPPLAAADGWSDKAHYATLRMGDVDGDGRADLCGRGREGFDCWLFTGHRFDRLIRGPRLADADGWNRKERFRSIRLADVDADGRHDLCARDDTGMRCWISDGRGFPVEYSGPPWGAAWDTPERLHTIRLSGVIETDAPREWPDAGTGDAGRRGGGPAASGCGCRIGAPSGVGMGWAFVLGALLLRRRRRRRRRWPAR